MKGKGLSRSIDLLLPIPSQANFFGWSRKLSRCTDVWDLWRRRATGNSQNVITLKIITSSRKWRECREPDIFVITSSPCRSTEHTRFRAELSALPLYSQSFSSDHHVVFVEGSAVSSKLRLFPHTELSIWPLRGTVLTDGIEGSAMSSKLHLCPHRAFHLTTMWYCIDWWNVRWSESDSAFVWL